MTCCCKTGGEHAIIEQINVEQLSTPEATYNFEVEDFHTYYVTESNILTHNKCVATEGAYEARVNTSNEHGKPHAHILKDGKRMAKVNIAGEVVNGALDKGGKRFVNKFLDKIVQGIKSFYPKK